MHTLSVTEAVKRLGTDPERGLTAEQARRLLEQVGPNELPEEAPICVPRPNPPAPSRP